MQAARKRAAEQQAQADREFQAKAAADAADAERQQKIAAEQAAARRDAEARQRAAAAQSAPAAAVAAPAPGRAAAAGAGGGSNAMILGAANLRSVFRSAAELGANGDIARTQEILQPLFGKPKLTDKLLSKPPFRFLHDIVMAVIASTNFGVGLYTPEESDGELVKEKDPKMAFLQKLINFLGIFLNTHCSAKPKSIVAGLEPEKTNEMLQLLAVAATLNQPSQDAVNRVLAGEAQPEPDGSRVGFVLPAASVPVSAAPAPQQVVHQSSFGRLNEAAAAAKDLNLGGAALSSATTPSAAAAATGGSSPSRIQREENAKLAAERDSGSGAAARGSAGAAAAGIAASLLQQHAPASSTSSSSTAAATAGSTRPQTARRRPPKIKEAGAEGGNAGGAVSSNFLAEGADDSEEDEEAGGVGDGGADGRGRSVAEAAAAGGGQGKHTRDILAEQQRRGAGAQADRAGEGGSGSSADKDGEGGIRFGRLKKATGGAGSRGSSIAYSQADLEQLQDAIQKLAQSTIPLGKSMDYVTEDVDDMRSELRVWQQEYLKRKDGLDKEIKESEEFIAPYLRNLAESEEKVREAQRRIASMKASIAKNDQRISELLRMVVLK